MTTSRIALPLALLGAMACGGVASAQTTAPRAVTQAAPANGTIAPRTPGGTSVGTTQNDQTRVNSTVGGIDNHLLEQEKDRPTLPNQTPSPSQTLPGGTASGQTPR